MTRFVKSFLFELVCYVVGYIVYRATILLGRTTLHLGRAVFNR